ncbi:MAG: long-chain fatty acid--CoA ligase [Hyphomicrobiales bacterium]|nr:MAG: long-chain fatty acid--CoA ligase [Hyphomicrobiales bacterium]
MRSGASLDASAIRAAIASRTNDLARLGLDAGDRIVVGEADPVDFIIALFACWQAGLVAVAVNPALAGPEQANVIATTSASAWLGELRTTLPPPTTGKNDVLVPLGVDAPALILMTSGTTGRPKGIVHTQRSLSARIELNIAAIGSKTLSHSLCVLPVFFGHGLIGNALTPLLSGGTVHLWPTPGLAELPNLGPYLDSHRIGFMSSVPSFWKLALRLSPRPSQPLQRVHVGSAPLGVGLWRDIAAWAGTDSVLNMFGMTETANWIGGATLAEAAGRDGHVGRIWGGSFAIRADDGTVQPAGRGEVLVKSPSIMRGYFERPDLDAEAFADGWFRTGDTGDLSADGDLTLVGRIKSEINRGGIKVQAEEVDMLLERHPDIAEACAFGIPDPSAGEAVAAAIVLKPGAVLDPEAIKRWCRNEARADAVPSRLYAVGAIPRNDRGKIVRADVRALVESPT